jgi:uncharacterized protein (DUF1330 family)
VYLVCHNRIHNPEKMQEYFQKGRVTLASHDHETLVFAEHSEVLEGNTHLPRTVIIKFDSRDAALAWYNSPEYQAVLPLRLEATEGYTVLVEGRQ